MAQKAPETVPFIIGLVVGLLFGNIPAVIGFLGFMLLFNGVFKIDNVAYAFIPLYATGVALGIWGFRLLRKRLDFLSGLVIGATAAFLCASAVCNVLVSGTGNMH